MGQIEESELDYCIGMMDEVCSTWEFNKLLSRVIFLLEK